MEFKFPQGGCKMTTSDTLINNNFSISYFFKYYILYIGL